LCGKTLGETVHERFEVVENGCYARLIILAWDREFDLREAPLRNVEAGHAAGSLHNLLAHLVGAEQMLREFRIKKVRVVETIANAETVQVGRLGDNPRHD